MTILARRVLFVVLIVLAMGGVSCGSSEDSAPETATLSGTWAARFGMETAENLPQPTAARWVEGRLIMEAGPPGSAEPPSPTPRPVMRGRFAVDFTPLGFTLGGTSAIAWYSAAPTLSIILHPDVAQGNIAITGIQNGETIEGQWQLLGDPTRASGKVRLTRAGRE